MKIEGKEEGEIKAMNRLSVAGIREKKNNTPSSRARGE